MKYHIGVLSFAILIVFGFSGNNVLAADEPMIYVQDLKLATTTLHAGETVSGSGVLVNNGSADVPDVSYIASIVGDYKNGDPYTLFDSKTIGSVYIKAGEHKKVTFSYKVPIFLNGKGYGFELTAGLSSGKLLGWDETPVTVIGTATTNAISIKKASIKVDNNYFQPEEGPTVRQNEKAVISVTAVNQSSTSSKITSRIVVFNRTIDGQVLYSSSSAPFTIGAKAETLTEWQLPNLNNKPGVYAFTVAYYDSSGNKISRSVEGRYIIGGDTATIQSISSDKQVLKNGDFASVSVIYDGTPIDITNPTAGRGQKANLTVRLYNQNDHLVSETTQEVSLDASNKQVALSMPISGGAHALRVEAEINKEGKVLATYGANLSESYDSMRGIPEIDLSKVMYVAIALVIIIIGFLLMRRKKISHNAGIALIIISFGFVGATAIVSAGSYTHTVYNEATYTLNGPSIVVNTPIDYERMRPGQTFDIAVRVSSSECNNVPADMSVVVKFNGVRKTATISREGVDCHQNNSCANVDLAIHKTFHNFTAPTAFGIYNVEINAGTNWYNPGGTFHGESHRLITLWIPDPRDDNSCPVGMHLNSNGVCTDDDGSNNGVTDVCPNITGTQTTVPPDMHIDASGQCISNDGNNDGGGTDVCPNITGTQTTVPPDMHIDASGQCVVGDDGGNNGGADICPNIVGVQTSVPANMHLDALSNCVSNTGGCTAGASCTSIGVNKCGLHDGITICTASGPLCVPLDPLKCNTCPDGHILCNGVCILGTTCPLDITCKIPNSDKVIKEGESVILYDIQRGISADNNCSIHQERRTCEVDHNDPTKGALSGVPNPSDDPHVFERCTPYFKEV